MYSLILSLQNVNGLLKFLNASHNKVGLLQGGCNAKAQAPRDFSMLFKPLTYLGDFRCIIQLNFLLSAKIFSNHKNI